jgi:myo-inositol 2-dehydrogenase/D-chiro-inositol 1-dehydrogenase
MRIGLIGVGRIGALHAQTLQSLAQVDELTVVDTDAGRARQAAAELGVAWGQDVGDLLAGGVDGVVIATPSDTHAPLIRAAAEAGVAVFCEKPVAADVAETKEVVQLVEKSNARVQIGFQRRFDAGFLSAREQMQAKKLGWLHTIRAGTMDPSPPPAAFIRSSGGIFRDCSVHDIDAVRWVSGREVSTVYATGSNQGAAFFREAGDVDTGAALLTLDDGTLAIISATRYNGAGYDVRLELLGSEDSISVGLDDRLPLRSAEPGVTWPAGRAYANFLERFWAAYIAELEAFVDVVSGRSPSPCSPADALETFYVAEACELSRRERRPVQMDEVRV